MHRKTIFEKVADPEVQAEWRKVKIKGDRPTPEEVINYAVGTLSAEQR